jgi:hypothetical protein
VAGVAARVLDQIVLVLRLGFPERAGGGELGYHLAGPEAGGVDVGDGVHGDAALRVVGVVDRRAIAGADVVALAVLGGRIVDLEEELQDLAEAGLRRVERDLDRFGMGAVVAVGGVGHVAAGVADAGPDHAGQAADQVLHAPEAAPGEHGLLYGHRGVLHLSGRKMERRMGFVEWTKVLKGGPPRSARDGPCLSRSARVGRDGG